MVFRGMPCLDKFLPVDPVSNICFVGDTVIQTDQGNVIISTLYENIMDASHTYSIEGQSIKMITRTKYSEKYLILIKKSTLGDNVPNQDTILTGRHHIEIGDRMVQARVCLSIVGVTSIPYNNQYLYNVLLDTHTNMVVNGMVAETLNPSAQVIQLLLRPKWGHIVQILIVIWNIYGYLDTMSMYGSTFYSF